VLVWYIGMHLVSTPGTKDLTSLVWAEVIQAYNGAFTPDVNLLLNENLGGILSGTQCQMGDSLMLSEG